MLPPTSGSLYAGCVFAILAGFLSQTTLAADDLPDGLKVEVLKQKGCKTPTHRGHRVEMHYVGTLEDGTTFDSSRLRGSPFSFVIGAGQVIKGWDLGLLDMCIGDQRRLTIPPNLAYGERARGKIPAHATLIFETELMGISGVPASDSYDLPAPHTNEDEEKEGGETELPTIDEEEVDKIGIPISAEEQEAVQEEQDSMREGTNNDSGDAPAKDQEQGECRLLGPFALFVQGGLGLLALVALVIKRWRERPQRPIKVWLFDASKQVFGAALVHVFNVMMSTLSAGEYELQKSVHDAAATATAIAANHERPNPCSFYLINIAVDTTIGIPILVMILKVLHHVAALTPLASPPESIKSGHYGYPPRVSWWLKQSILYFIGLLLMKLCVFFIFEILPWIIIVGNWALRWTQGSEALQIAFVMFVFPLMMNMLQLWIIDSFIKERGSDSSHAYEQAPGEQPADEADEGGRLRNPDDFDERFGLGRDSDEGLTVGDDPRLVAARKGSDSEVFTSSASTPPGLRGKDKSS